MKYQVLFREYVWLLNTIFKCRRVSFDELNRRWTLCDLSEGQPMARSTFNRHKNAIEEIFGIFIECDRADGYKYYIANAEALERDTIQNWMLSTLTVNNLLSDHKSVHHRVLLEPVPSSEEHLGAIMDAMRNDVRIRIFYQKYSGEPGRERLVDPFCLKLYLRRWYVLARVEEGQTRLFSLDRIRSVELTDERFALPADFDAERHFADVIGVTLVEDPQPRRIVVRAYGSEPFYLRDLPLHASQRLVAQTGAHADFEYRLAPTPDLVRLLMSRGASVRVLEPPELALQLRDAHREAALAAERDD